jgi:hypothetical protein
LPALLALSRRIDRFSEWAGRWIAWLVLAAVLISAGNAVVRKAFNASSNAFLEIQWYLFSAVFLLAAGYTLHVAHLLGERFGAPPNKVSSDLGKLEARRQRTLAWALTIAGAAPAASTPAIPAPRITERRLMLSPLASNQTGRILRSGRAPAHGEYPRGCWRTHAPAIFIRSMSTEPIVLLPIV